MFHKEQVFEKNQSLARESANPEFERAHRAALDGVVDLDCSVKGQDLHLISIEASGGGAGAAAFRELFILRENLKLTGNIYARAAGTEPCLFYLYMGMIPCRFDFSKRSWESISEIFIAYIDTFFIGEDGVVNEEKSKIALEALAAFIDGKHISEESKIILKSILTQERMRHKETSDPNYNHMTDDDLKSNLSILIEIKNKTISELEGVFIPNVLKDLRKEMHEKKINLRRAGGVLEFGMTKLGLERAYDSIRKAEKIESFKAFEHLPLTPDQKEELGNILKEREEYLRENHSSARKKLF